MSSHEIQTEEESSVIFDKVLTQKGSGTSSSFVPATGLEHSLIMQFLLKYIEEGKIIKVGEIFFTKTAWEKQTKSILSTLDKYHKTNPSKAGMPKETLQAASPLSKNARAFDAYIAQLKSEKLLIPKGALIHSASFKVQLTAKQEALLSLFEDTLKKAGVLTPNTRELSQVMGLHSNAVKELISMGLESGRLIRVMEGLFYHVETLEEIKRLVKEFITKNGSITVSQFRDISGSSRRYSVLLLEYLDSIQFTMRDEDARILA